MRTPITVGIAGLNDRGLAIAQAFDDLPTADLRLLCDRSADVGPRIGRRFSSATTVTHFEDLCADEQLDLIVITTPVATHYELARRALDADKHVLVERPIALRGEDAEDLVRRAKSRALRLMFTNDLIFHPAVQRLKESIELGALGELYYLHGDRHDPGIGSGTNVIWSLGTDHVSLIMFLLGDEPISVAARGEPYLQADSEDVVFCSLKFATGISAHIHLSRLDPREAWSLATVGSRRMGVLEDTQAERKLTLYERDSALRPTDVPAVEAHLGDIVIPRLPKEDALERDCERVIALVRSSPNPLEEGRDAVAVVHVLEALDRSLDRGGLPEPVGGDGGLGSAVVALPTALSRTAAASRPTRGGRT